MNPPTKDLEVETVSSTEFEEECDKTTSDSNLDHNNWCQQDQHEDAAEPQPNEDPISVDHDSCSQEEQHQVVAVNSPTEEPETGKVNSTEFEELCKFYEENMTVSWADAMDELDAIK